MNKLQGNNYKQDPLLFFWPGYFMYAGHAVDTVVHDHHAIQIAISLNDTIEIILPDKVDRQKAVIINSDQQHECRTYQTDFLLLNIDPDIDTGMRLKKIYLDGRQVAALPTDPVAFFLDQIAPALASRNTPGIINVTKHFIDSLSLIVGERQFDDRIIKVLQLLSEPGHKQLRIKEISEEVFMSPSRLIHLFTEQVGIPIRKYILWSRLLSALQKIAQTKNITYSALEGGFTDIPHFNRTFKRMFGLKPTLLLKNSQIIQVYAQVA